MNEICNLINECGKYVKEGIYEGDMKMPFTLIDYYCLLNKYNMQFINHVEIRKIAYILRRKSELLSSELNRFTDFLEKENIIGSIINNPVEILNCNYRFIFDNNVYIPTYEDVSLIMNLFDMYNIPKCNKLIYQALHRYARGFSVVPLLIEDENKLSR